MGTRGERRPEAVSDLIPRVLDEVGLGEASEGVRLLRVWDNALGPELAPHCRVQGLRRGVVQALVRDSAWMQRLSLAKPLILTRLRASLGEAAVEDLRFRIGEI